MIRLVSFFWSFGCVFVNSDSHTSQETSIAKRNIRKIMVRSEWSNTSGGLLAALYAPRCSHITPLMCELHWLPLKQRIHFKILLFAFKAIHGIAPTYIQNLVSLKSQGAYKPKSSGGILLALSTFRTKVTLGDRSFQAAGPKLWMLYCVIFAMLQTWILLRAILSRTFLSLFMVECI